MAQNNGDVEILQKALAFDNLQKTFADLEEKYKNEAEKKSDLEQQLQQCQTELNQAKLLHSSTEQNKAGLDLQVSESENNIRELQQYANDLASELQSKRDMLLKAHQELNECRQSEIGKSIEVEKASSEVWKLTVVKQNLETGLKAAVESERYLKKQVKTFQDDYDNLKDQNQSEKKRLSDKLQEVIAERNIKADLVDQLQLNLDHEIAKLVIAEDKLATITRERDLLEIKAGSTSKAYKELSAIYDESQSNFTTKSTEYETKIKTITSERNTLEITKSSLEQQLTELKELNQNYIKQLTGVTDKSAKDSKNNNSSNLLSLIRKYGEINQHPEDVYQDFFNLRDKYSRAVFENKTVLDTNAKLQRTLNEKEILLDRLYREKKAENQKNMQLSAKLEKESKASREFIQVNNTLKKEIVGLTGKNNTLEASLKDTTYQLQHVLFEVQKRNEPIPVVAKDSAILLASTDIMPTLSNKQLTFNDVASLQDRNRELVDEVRALTEKERVASDELSSTKSKTSNDTNLYVKALEEAKQTAADLTVKTKELESKLNTVTTECVNYKEIISQLGDGDAAAKFAEIKATQLRQRGEVEITFEAYRQETLEEMNKLKQEIQTTRAAASEARAQLSSVNVEIAHLRQKYNKLISSHQQAQEQSKAYIREKENLQEHLNNRNREVKELQDQARNMTSRNEVLNSENTVLNIRVESANTAYNLINERFESNKDENMRTKSLLEAINGRMEMFSSLSTENSEKSKESIARLTRELQHARDQLAEAEKQINSYKSVNQQEIQDKYKESMAEISLLKDRIKEMEKQYSEVNQERIVAQTKLATVEEQLKKTAEGANASEVQNNDCDEHIRQLAEAQDRIRILESEAEGYHTAIAQSQSKVDELTKEHETLVSQTKTTVESYVKELKERANAVSEAQLEAEKSIAEYKTLHQDSLADRAVLADEKHSLEEQVKELNTSVLTKDDEIKSLRETTDQKEIEVTETKAKLETETKTVEEQRKTISTLRADVSKLTSDVTEYKANADAVQSSVDALKDDYKRQVNDATALEMELKQQLKDSEKTRTELTGRVEELVKKYSELEANQESENGIVSNEFKEATAEILQQLRETNTTLRIQKDAAESKYRYEHDQLRRAEAELEPAKKQITSLQDNLKALRVENQKLAQQSAEESNSEKLERDAFKVQNISLCEEIEKLRKEREQARVDVEKLEAQITPRTVEISTLKSELEVSKEEVARLTNSQREWMARSAALLAKHNRIDPAETDRLKQQIQTLQSELETAKTEKTTLEDSAKESLVKYESEVKRLDEDLRKRQRFYQQKISSTNNLLNSSKSQAEIAKKEHEEIKTKLEEDLKKAKKEHEEIKTKLEEDLKKAEKSKEVDTDKNTQQSGDSETIANLEASLAESKKKHNDLVRLILRMKNTDKEQKEKITAVEAELAKTRKELEETLKTLSEKNIELSRLNASLAMAKANINRVQKKLSDLEAANSTAPSTLNPIAPAFVVPVSTPSQDTPQIRRPQISSPKINNVQATKPRPVQALFPKTKISDSKAPKVATINGGVSKTEEGAIESIETESVAAVSQDDPTPIATSIETPVPDTLPVAATKNDVEKPADKIESNKGSKAPAATEFTPAATEPTPAAAEPAPVVTESTPVVTESAPDVTEPVPIVTESVSATVTETVEDHKQDNAAPLDSEAEPTITVTEVTDTQDSLSAAVQEPSPKETEFTETTTAEDELISAEAQELEIENATAELAETEELNKPEGDDDDLGDLIDKEASTQSPSEADVQEATTDDTVKAGEKRKEREGEEGEEETERAGSPKKPNTTSNDE